MRRYVAQGCTVARVKGGDPFVFGRGGEERMHLAAHGIEVEAIPGVTAGVAVPELAGIPVTHRGVASGVTFVTGHAGGGCEPDWTRLAQLGTTLVIYMGLARIEAIVERLLAGGMRPDTPAAVIAHGSLPAERQVFAPLAAIAAASRSKGVATPALIVIGNVVALAPCGAARNREFESREKVS
jgi:uroporphyrin-III C-methyltransferase